jgi:hypothetical protein
MERFYQSGAHIPAANPAHFAIRHDSEGGIRAGSR